MQKMVKMSLRFKGIIIGLVLFLSACISLNSAPKLSCMRHFTVDDGLSQNMVYCIYQDSRGYMWFGTQDGLNRFDGHNFTIYDKDLSDARSVGSKGFFSITEYTDGKIWFATTDGVKIYDPERDEFAPFVSRTIGGESVTGQVRDLYVADDGCMWVCCQNGNLFKWDGFNLSVFNLSALTDAMEPLNLRGLTVDDDGIVYVATYGAGIIVLDTRTGDAETFRYSRAYSNDVNAVYCLSAGTVLVATSTDGVLLFDKTSRTFSPFQINGADRNLFVRSLMCCSDRMIWIGTESGLYIYDTRSSEVTKMEYSVSDPYSLSDNAVYAIYEDRDEGVWVGTYFGGVNYITKSAVFEKHYPIPGMNSIGGRSISEFARCGDYIWIGTEDAGLYRYDVASKYFSRVPVAAKNIHALMEDGRNVWVGTFTRGIYLLDSGTMAVKRRWTASGGGLSDDNIYSIYKDGYGRVWVGTMSGLHYYDTSSGRFVQVQQKMLYSQVNDIQEDSKGLLWIATSGSGIWTYDRPRDKWTHYPRVIDSFTASGVSVNCMLEDHDGRMWIGTDGDGLCLYDKGTDTFQVRFDSRSGLLNDVIYALECDRLGNVWGSTNKGLFRIDVRSMEVSTYTHESGLLSDQFNYKSGFADDDGTMYFGTIKGFVSFEPEKMMAVKYEPSPFVSGLDVNGNRVPVSDGEHSLLTEPIYETKEISLPHDVDSFGLELNEINFAPSHSNVYYYTLDGWDKMWFTAQMPYVVTYSNIPAGKYVFKVRSSLDEEAEDLVNMGITVKPSMWFTWWALLLELLLIVSIVCVVIYLLNKRMENRRREQEKVEAEEREKILYNAKLDFFSNITHEIKAPLSLIRMPLEEMISKSPKGSPQYNNMLIIRDNADRLLSLVNQLLDFRKVNGNKEIQFVHADAVRVLSKTVTRFQPSADVNNIQMTVSMPDSLYVDVNVEMFTKMISNLLSNALKYAGTRINVEMSQSAGSLILSVSNDGDVIPADMAEKVFSPFFKLQENSEGFGIGLPFVRTMVELHSGNIVLIPHEEEEMTEFRLTLPLEHENTLWISSETSKAADVEEEELIHNIGTSYRRTVLLVDDDTSFIDYVANQLDSTYKVRKVHTGERALEYLGRHNVDIVISDLNLPGMNGIELCETIKGDKRYASIPVILLSSENSREIKAAGISAGANMYIEKPCYMDYLVSSIENIFKSGYIAEVTKLSEEQADSSIVYTEADGAFMKRLTELIYAHIEEVDLDVNRLAALMSMSRATLYRKIKDSLHITPNDFIRIIRLKKAAEFLRQKEYRINEIAYIVGFSSASYFSKCFKKQYGVLPKDFV